MKGQKPVRRKGLFPRALKTGLRVMVSETLTVGYKALKKVLKPIELALGLQYTRTSRGN